MEGPVENYPVQVLILEKHILKLMEIVRIRLDTHVVTLVDLVVWDIRRIISSYK